jgi:hypothetical protein
MSYKSPFIKHESPQSLDQGLSYIAGSVRIVRFGEFEVFKTMREDK